MHILVGFRFPMAFRPNICANNSKPMDQADSTQINHKSIVVFSVTETTISVVSNQGS